MNATTTVPVTIEGVDLDAEVPCNDPDHEHPADVIAALECPVCGRISEALCWDWIRRLRAMRSAEHPSCRTWLGPPEAWLRIIEVLR